MTKIQSVVNFVFAAAIGVAFLCIHGNRQKIVFVNSGKVLLEYQGMKVAQQAFQAKAVSWQSNVDTLEAELKASVKAFEQQKKDMTAKEAALSEELLRQKHAQFVQYREAMQQKGAEEDQKLKEQVLTQVNAFLKQYGQKHGYTFIMGATDMGNIVYAQDVTDITEDVVKHLNAQYKPQ